MSYILDALRKSERDRALAEGRAEPVAWQMAEQSSAGGRWVLPLLVLMALLILGALILNLLPQQRPDDDIRSRDAEAALTGAQLAAVTPDGEAAERAVVTDPAPVAVPVQPDPVRSDQVKSDPVLTATAPALVGPDTEAVSGSKPDEEARTMPPLDTLRHIPQLMINSHIYSPVADKRSVVINNRQWNEGDMLAAGVLLKEITPDGILLDVDGWPVHVGRSKGWQAIP